MKDNIILAYEARILSEHFTTDPQVINPDMVTVLRVDVHHKENATKEQKRIAAKRAIHQLLKDSENEG